MDTSEQVRVRECKRRFRPVEEKRRIVEEALQPGTSVARVARAHGVNANQLFAWRRLYQQGRLEPKIGAAPALLAVRVSSAKVPEAERSTAAPTRRTPSGVIHVELPKGQLRIAGHVDVEALRIVLDQLLK